ncbi:hypothetical protein HK101_005917 [Irineochytrium annulatum]|nr:hypothetical protein HK101_005917 [Irineochytrium annulatum]
MQVDEREPLLPRAYRGADALRRNRRCLQFTAVALTLGAVVALFVSPIGRGREPVAEPETLWRPCVGVEGMDCGSIDVPLDHLRGGPGGSGVDKVESIGRHFSTITGGQHDVVGFDPRGIARSRSVRCSASAREHSATAQNLDPHAMTYKTAPEALDAWVNVRATGCEKNDSDFIKYISTAYTARDMDFIREKLGMEELNYWGFSYGTFLGLTYANMFPGRVDRFVIDGATNPFTFSGSSLAWSRSSLTYNDDVYRLFGSACELAGGFRCALASLRGNGTVAELIASLIEQLDKQPMPAPNARLPRILTASNLQAILFEMGYNPSSWPDVASAVATAVNGDATALRDLTGAEPDAFCPLADTSGENGFLVYKCNDGDNVRSVSLSEWAEVAGEMQELSPMGGERILILANTLDNVSPIDSARIVYGELTSANAALLTHVGTGHCSLAQPSECTLEAVRDLFVNGVTPEVGTVCKADVELFPEPSLVRSASASITAALEAHQGLAKNWGWAFQFTLLMPSTVEDRQPLLPRVAAADPDAATRHGNRRCLQFTAVALTLAVVVALIVSPIGLVRSREPAPEAETLWKPCGDMEGMHCGSIDVPLDHLSTNDTRTIAIALIRFPATKEPHLGSILINPGGPGGSGVDMVKHYGPKLSIVTGGQHDIVGFDPRGIARSRSVRCSASVHEHYATAPSLDAFTMTYDTRSEAYDAWVKVRAAGCEKNDGDFIQYVSTAYTARDMDLIREMLGMKEMNYWGFSYGTFLGITYANMFPNHVGRFIIDGVTDPFTFSGVYLDWSLTSLVYNNEVNNLFGSSCELAGSSRCALASLRGNGTVMDLITSLRKQLEKQPMPAPNAKLPGVLTAANLQAVLFGMGYSPSSWPTVASAIAAAVKGDPTELKDLTGAKPDDYCPLTDNSGENGFNVVKCNDGDDVRNISLAEWDEVAGVMSGMNPVAGRGWTYLGLICRHWNIRPAERYTGPWGKNMKNKILILTNTLDNVTPIDSAQVVYRELTSANAVLLKQIGVGHCSLAQPSACTIAAVRDLFVDGVVPEVGTVCKADVELFPEPSLVRTASVEVAAAMDVHDGLNAGISYSATLVQYTLPNATLSVPFAQITISATIPPDQWVGLGISRDPSDPMMPNSELILVFPDPAGRNPAKGPAGDVGGVLLNTGLGKGGAGQEPSFGNVTMSQGEVYLNQDLSREFNKHPVDYLKLDC